MKHHDSPYQTENWKALEEVRKQRDEQDDAIAGYFIGFFAFFFVSIIVGKLIINSIK